MIRYIEHCAQDMPLIFIAVLVLILFLVIAAYVGFYAMENSHGLNLIYGKPETFKKRKKPGRW
jgi:hypothetical protein